MYKGKRNAPVFLTAAMKPQKKKISLSRKQLFFCFFSAHDYKNIKKDCFMSSPHLCKYLHKKRIGHDSS